LTLSKLELLTLRR